MPRPRATGPPVDDPITDPDAALADMLVLARALTRQQADGQAAAYGALLARHLLAMHAHLTAPTPGVLPAAWAAAPELAEGTLASCRHCRGLIRAQGPLPDWAAVNPQGHPALYCGANPAPWSSPGRMPLHEPRVAR